MTMAETATYLSASGCDSTTALQQPSLESCTLIACSMMEDEVREALRACSTEPRVVWVDRGFHEKPEVLRVKLQECIDEAEDAGASAVLLAFGLCGNGAVGLQTRRAILAMPRFDDCVNLMLCTGARTCRGFAEAGVLYLTRGWAQDATLITGQRDLYVQKYGPRRAKRLMQGMYGSYKAVSLIDDGCYRLEDICSYAQECANTLELPVRVDPGSNLVLRKLLCGPWDDDILALPPQTPIRQEDFDFPLNTLKGE